MSTKVDIEKMVPETALQMAMEYKKPKVADCPVYQLTEEWQEKILVKTGYASVAKTLSELENLLGENDPECIILPDDAAITTEALTTVLQRNSAEKTILWGVPLNG
ncbi:MAG: hypothetical protein MJ247_01180 [Alphaproteobacteria bacterium]|nr:hypothetical protein [Alphaproteobacteria bacterium]